MEIIRQLQQNLPPYAVDIIRLTIWLFLLLIFFVPLEKLFAVHPHRFFRKSVGVDLGYYFLNNLFLASLLTFPAALIAWALRHVIPAGLHTSAEALPLLFRLPAAFVVGEVGYYWGHRATHEIPLLWRFHAIHHSAEEMDWLVNTRAHPLDSVFVRLCGFLPMYALGLAQPLRGRHLDTVPLLVMLIGTLWGYFIHANLRWRFGWLSWLIATPAFHHWHHTRDDHTNRNYAPMLPMMDKIFGTLYLPKKQWPASYGTDSPVPDSLAGQLLSPLLPAPGQTNIEMTSAPLR
jgi:sterol desaturase/sphingolipid hydroxylase (fatty acid hydroxylase superfamily)